MSDTIFHLTYDGKFLLMPEILCLLINLIMDGVAAAQCKKICAERLNWPGGLAGIS